ncbi:MAG: hypothetical protein NUV92_10840 [Ignavibacteria bacterium]|nr:hypothetical protein [Ignavibacteria bacterium]MDH7528530.1 hypothetical protein [Ignavibacteria bacterium]
MNDTLKSHFKNYWLSYLLSFAAIYFLLNRGTYTFLDLVDLFIHEPGHLIFGLFGEFIQFLGGTLMQIILPFSVGVVFFLKGQRYLSQIFFFWLGHNFTNISVYVDDANKMKLRIIGGAHDWNWILNKLNIIEYAEEIGYAFVAMAIFSFLFMFFVPYFIRDYEFD